MLVLSLTIVQKIIVYHVYCRNKCFKCSPPRFEHERPVSEGEADLPQPDLEGAGYGAGGGVVRYRLHTHSKCLFSYFCLFDKIEIYLLKLLNKYLLKYLLKCLFKFLFDNQVSCMH